MRVGVQKNNEGSWNITPLEGKFYGICIARADEIALDNTIERRYVLAGELVSVWGMLVLEDEVYDDEPTLLGLRIGKPFIEEWILVCDLRAILASRR